MARRRLVLAASVGVLALAACTTPGGAPESMRGPSSPSAAGSPTASAPSTTTRATSTTSTSTRAATPPPRADAFDADRVLAGIRDLAAIGPRDAASASYDKAARLVAERFRAAGYRVTLQPFRVPAGVSWGVRVPAGDVVNVVADPPGFDASDPHLIIGAHLDTVPQAPGAEDNASGVMVMLETARRLRQQPAALPVRFVAFGAEEARSSDGHSYAFGSRHFVAELTDAERRAVRGMVALDRVGVRAPTVPVCSGGRGTPALARAIRAAAPGSVPTRSCTNRASDHVSFEAAGIPAVRIGSVPYAAYHSARDVPSVVDQGQLTRVGAVLWAWLRSLDR